MESWRSERVYSPKIFGLCEKMEKKVTDNGKDMVIEDEAGRKKDKQRL